MFKLRWVEKICWHFWPCYNDDKEDEDGDDDDDEEEEEGEDGDDGEDDEDDDEDGEDVDCMIFIPVYKNYKSEDKWFEKWRGINKFLLWYTEYTPRYLIILARNQITFIKGKIFKL